MFIKKSIYCHFRKMLNFHINIITCVFPFYMYISEILFAAAAVASSGWFLALQVGNTDLQVRFSPLFT